MRGPGWFGCVFVTRMVRLDIVRGPGDWVLTERLSVSDRDVRIGELIGRYRTLEPFLLVSSALDGDEICTFCPLVTAMLHPHTLACAGG